MHPEIKKFWEDAGYIIEEPGYITDPIGDRIQSGTVSGYKKIGPNSCISIIETLAFGNSHRINKKWYSEEDMLRIIRLKTFL
jgi:hypothetical protein